MQTLIVVFVTILSVIVSLVLIYLPYKTAVYSFNTNVDKDKVRCKKDLCNYFDDDKLFIKGKYYKLNMCSDLPIVENEYGTWCYFSFTDVGNPLRKLSDYFEV